MSEVTDCLQIITSSDHGEGSLRWALEIAARREFLALAIDPSLSCIALEQQLSVIVPVAVAAALSLLICPLSPTLRSGD